MNDIITTPTITDYDSLIREKERAKETIKAKMQLLDRNLSDMTDLVLAKAEPITDTFTTIRKFISTDPQANGAIELGSNVTIDWIMRKVIPASNPMLRFVIPTLLKNYSSHYVNKAVPFVKKMASKLVSLRNNGNQP